MADLPELRMRSDRDRLDFLHTDLALCFTFADLALTELAMNDRESAEQLLTKADEGRIVMLRFLPGVKDVAEYERLAGKLTELRARLESVTLQVRSAQMNNKEEQL